MDEGGLETIIRTTIGRSLGLGSGGKKLILVLNLHYGVRHLPMCECQSVVIGKDISGDSFIHSIFSLYQTFPTGGWPTSVGLYDYTRGEGNNKDFPSKLHYGFLRHIDISHGGEGQVFSDIEFCHCQAHQPHFSKACSNVSSTLNRYHQDTAAVIWDFELLMLLILAAYAC